MSGRRFLTLGSVLPGRDGTSLWAISLSIILYNFFRVMGVASFNSEVKLFRC